MALNSSAVENGALVQRIDLSSDSLKEENVIAGFKMCGIPRLNRNKVLSMPPAIDIKNNQDTQNVQKTTDAVENSFKELLQN